MSTPLAPPPPRPCSWAQWFPGRRVAGSLFAPVWPGSCDMETWWTRCTCWYENAFLGGHIKFSDTQMGHGEWKQDFMGTWTKPSRTEKYHDVIGYDRNYHPLRPKWHDNLAISRGLTPANSHRKNPLSVHTLWGKKYHLQPLRKILILELTWTSYCRKIIPWCVFK